jgi:cell division protein YceG involved in septum cleavage
MYFVANPDGSSKFAKELDEHNANVAQYRQQTK